MILCIETATDLCSVALCTPEEVVAVKESNDPRSHASILTVMIQELLKEQDITASMLDAVAVSTGPGSYTGLRIGVSAAKGLAYSASLPVIATETPLAMFWGIRPQIENAGPDTVFCPMLDARRMEIYYALYDREGKMIKDISAEIVNEESFYSIATEKQIIVFGSGAAKCMNVIKRENIIYHHEYRISAAHMHKAVIQSFKDKIFEDVAYFEPLYLKDFITSRPKKNILGI